MKREVTGKACPPRVSSFVFPCDSVLLIYLALQSKFIAEVEMKPWMWRWIGVGYLSLAGFLLFLSGWNVFWLPDESQYEPPHACACLECLHPLAEDEQGDLYCSVFPPP